MREDVGNVPMAGSVNIFFCVKFPHYLGIIFMQNISRIVRNLRNYAPVNGRRDVVLHHPVIAVFMLNAAIFVISKVKVRHNMQKIIQTVFAWENDVTLDVIIEPRRMN